MMGRPLNIIALCCLFLSSCNLPNSDDREQDGLIRAGDRVNAAGDPSSAINVYKSALEKEKSPSNRLRLSLKLGEAYMSADHLDEAKRVYEEALPYDENNEVKRQLGRLYLTAGQPDNAITIFNEILSKHRDDIKAINGLGVAYDLKKQHAKAQEYYHKGLSINEDNAEIKSNLGLSLAFEGHYEEALKLLQPLGESVDATSKQRHNLAIVYGLAGDQSKAQAMYAKDMDESKVQENLSALRTVAKPQPTLDDVLTEVTETPKYQPKSAPKHTHKKHKHKKKKRKKQ
jgi:Flp pilus assembly protein TadD